MHWHRQPNWLDEGDRLRFVPGPLHQAHPCVQGVQAAPPAGQSPVPPVNSSNWFLQGKWTSAAVLPSTLHPQVAANGHVFGLLKGYVSRVADRWMRSHPGSNITIYDVPSIVAEALPEAATVKNITSGFSSPGIWPFKPSAFQQMTKAKVSQITENIGHFVAYSAALCCPSPPLSPNSCIFAIWSQSLVQSIDPVRRQLWSTEGCFTFFLRWLLD